jgi:hypothetical protein
MIIDVFSARSSQALPERRAIEARSTWITLNAAEMQTLSAVHHCGENLRLGLIP